jgi:hypothetical protein
MTDTHQQLPLLFTTRRSYEVRDQVRYAVEIANAEGLAAATNAQVDGRSGRVKIYLCVDELDEVILRLIQFLQMDGWSRTGDGAEWIVSLPPELFSAMDYTAALEYACAFKSALRREMHPEQFRFKIESKYTCS